MKEFISGAIAAFSVVAVYNLAKHIVFKKKPNTIKPKASIALANLLDEPSNGNTIIPDNLFGQGKGHKFLFSAERANEILNNGKEEDIQPKPKLVSFNKEYIEERKELQTPSGVALISSRKKGIFFFKHEIQNVIENTDDKIVIFDYLEYFKPVLSSLGVDYTEISKDELNEDIMEKYERSIGDKNAELPYIAPLTERITCFNVQNKEDVEAALRYVFMRSKATVGKEYPKRVWLYIPSHQITHYHAKQLYTLMKRSRMAGVIMTAAAEMDSLIIDESVRLIANMQDYLAFTDDIDKYYVSDTLRELICSVDKAYQFDINISQEEENELKYIAFEFGNIMEAFL